MFNHCILLDTLELYKSIKKHEIRTDKPTPFQTTIIQVKTY